MRPIKSAVVLMVVLGLLIGCDDEPEVTEEPDEPEEVEPEPDPEPEPEEVEDEMVWIDPSQDSADLLEDIENYGEWDHHAGVDTHFESGHPGDVWVIAYANEAGIETVEQEQIPVPEGAIFVKEEYDGDGVEDPSAVTVMAKLSDEMGDWYWLKSDPELEQVMEMEGMALEGTEDLGCIGCHAEAADRDYLMAPAFEAP